MHRITGFLIAAMLIGGVFAVVYVVAPILIPLALVTAGMGVLTFGVVSLARGLERRRAKSAFGAERDD